MSKNLLLFGYDYKKIVKLGERLANTFDVKNCNLLELFEFNNIPNSFADIFLTNGKRYITNEFKGLIKSTYDFSDMIVIANLKMIDICADFLSELKEKFLVVFIKNSADLPVFKTDQEREYFEYDSIKLDELEEELSKEFSDIVVEAKNLDDTKLFEIALNKLENLA